MISHRETFSNVERRTRETDKFFSNKRERVMAMTVQDEKRILDIIDDEAHISTRNLSPQTGISQASVHRFIRRNILHSCIQKV